MKRSELINFIAQNIERKELGILRNKHCSYALKNADWLLRIVEKAGMLPPPKKLDKASNIILHYYVQDSIEKTDKLDNIEEFNNNNIRLLWEPEDES